MIERTREELLAMAEAKAEEGPEGQSSEARMARELAALRLTIAAGLVPDVVLEALPDLGPVRLELFGHTVVFGHAREEVVAGKRFVRLEQPAVVFEGETLREASAKSYHANAVYAIASISEEEMMDHARYAADLWQKPDGSWFKRDWDPL